MVAWRGHLTQRMGRGTLRQGAESHNLETTVIGNLGGDTTPLDVALDCCSRRKTALGWGCRAGVHVGEHAHRYL